MNGSQLYKNIEMIMKAYDVDFFSDLINNGKELTLDIQVENTKNDMKTFKYEDVDKNRIYVHSKYDPIKEANRVLEGINFSQPAIYIIHGIGMGYHVEELIKKIHPKSKIVIIEKNKDIVLNYAIYSDVYKNLIERNILLICGEEEEIVSKMSEFSIILKVLTLMNNVVSITLPSYEKIYGLDWIKKINRRIADLFKNSFFQSGNDVEDTIMGLYNNFENIIELIKSPDIGELKNKYMNKPAIIVSAGPSLNKNIKELKKAQGKALIFANDATVNILQENDIVPDAVFAIERGIETYDAFFKDRDIDERITFVGPPVVRPEILKSIKGKNLLALKERESLNAWMNNMLGDNRLLDMGTSCAHVCFAFAKHIGANPIIFTGQDLAFTNEGITHADGVEVKGKVDLEKEEVFYVEGANGEMLPTNYAYRNFLIWFETQIAKDTSNRSYINATEGGAKIKGTKDLKLKDVIDQYCIENIEPLLNVIPEENKVDNKISVVLEELKSKEKDFSNFREMMGKHLDLLEATTEKLSEDRILEEKEIKEIFEIFNKIYNFDTIIFKDDIIRMFFQPVYINYHSKLNRIESEMNKESAQKMCDFQMNMVRTMIEICSIVEKDFGKVIDGVNEKYSKYLLEEEI